MPRKRGKQAAMPYRFKCPYCFAECEDDKVLFRATYCFDERQLHNLSSEDSERNIKQFFVKNSKDSPKVKNLIRFWERKGAESGYITDPGWNMPYIDPQDKDFVQLIRANDTGRLKVGEDGFVRDKDGFVLRVVDRYGSEFQPMKRLCRYCLNPFPLEDYGKREIKFISVVGTTGAGKTVYLHQLLMRFASAMAGTNYKVEASNLSDLGEHVDPDHPLPGATDTRVMRRPLAVNLQADQSHGNKKMTLVFYDVAGEHFSKNEDGQSEREASGGVTDYIRYSDALMILIDPKQISFLTRGGRAQLAEDVQNTIDVLFRLRGEWSNVPTAIVLTKSDMLENIKEIDSDSEIFRNIEHGDRGNGPSGFQRDSFVEVNRQIRDLFKDYAREIYHTIDQMDRPAFFAVSAITSGVEWKFEKNNHLFRLSAEDFEKLNQMREWVFYEWNGEEPMNPEQKKQMRCNAPQPPCKLSQPIPETQDITEEFARSVQTDLWGERFSYGQVLRCQLTLADVMTINVLGYPAGDPNPRRVEEPLQWILWRMGLLAPAFQPEPEPEKPRKGGLFAFLSKNSSDPQWTAEWNEAVQKAYTLFYDGAQDYTAPYMEFRTRHSL